MYLKKIISIIFLCFSVQLQCPTIGSNTSSSRQSVVFLPAAHTNELIGFSVFEGGFTFENSSTRCSFDAFFPMSGNMVLNGGILSLCRDVVLESPLKIGVGKIDGRTNSLLFPSNVSNLFLPSEYKNKVTSFCSKKDVGANINDLSWSFDDNYIAVVTDSFGGSEVQIYFVVDEQLTLTSSYNFGSNNVYSVDWHPAEYYLAIGKASGDELYTFSYDVSSATLEPKDLVDIGTVYDVAWSPDGSKLAVGKSDNYISVYEVQEGILSSVKTCTLYTVGSYKSIVAQKHGISWKSTGDYLAASFRARITGGTKYGIKIFKLEGNSFIDDAYLESSDYIYPISWKPGSNIIAIGMYKGSETIKFYRHNSDSKTLTEVVAAGTGETRAIYDISWGNNLHDSFLSYVKAKGSSDFDLQVNAFYGSDETQSLVSGYCNTELSGYISTQNVLRALAWSQNGNYIATGGTDDNLILLRFSQEPLVFKDMKLFFKSDINLNSQIIFDGFCILNGGNNILEFSNDACITVSCGSFLILEDVIIKGISGNKIECLDDDGLIMLKNVTWVQDDDYAFTKGALQFKNAVTMTGDYIFAYQTIKTSTIMSKSNLELDLGFTFSYNPMINDKNLLCFQDDTSILNLNGATLHTTVTGMQLTNGRLRVLRDSFISSEKKLIAVGSGAKGEYELIDEGITFGYEDSSKDLICDIYSGVTLHVIQGSLNYKNVLSSSWDMNNFTSVLYMYANTTLNLYQNLDLGPGSIIFGNNTLLGKASGKVIVGSMRPEGKLLYTNI